MASERLGAGLGRASIPLAAVVLLATACPGDDGAPADGTTTGATSTTGSSDSTAGATTSGSSSSGADSTSTSSAGSESSESSTGEPPGSGYGDCLDDPMLCAPGEVCLSFGPFAVCSEQGCRSADDCEMPPAGEAQPGCQDIDNDFSIDCYLDCSNGEACPDGMTCVGTTVCVWAPEPPGGGECPDEDVGSVVPQMLMGDNTGLFDDVIQTCGGGGGEDSLFMFTAPDDGTYRFDTAGTGFDTTLSVLDMCGGNELACNDDIGMVLTSQVDVDLVMGQSVIVVVDSYNGLTGPFNLNIDQRGLMGAPGPWSSAMSND